MSPPKGLPRAQKVSRLNGTWRGSKIKRNTLAASIRRWLWGSPQTTFVAYPVVTVAFEALRRKALPGPDPRYLPLLAWGYAQYKLCGAYRHPRAGGARGMERPPDRLVTRGPYGLSRNPMYLGHLIFAFGLALTLHSPLGLALAASRVVYFCRRVRADEERLERRFGD